jgi:DNA-nicking Smr family endonuclease
MKSAIRKTLATSPYVSASSPAPEDQGGDALTVSKLRG